MGRTSTLLPDVVAGRVLRRRAEAPLPGRMGMLRVTAGTVCTPVPAVSSPAMTASGGSPAAASTPGGLGDWTCYGICDLGNCARRPGDSRRGLALLRPAARPPRHQRAHADKAALVGARP